MGDLPQRSEIFSRSRSDLIDILGLLVFSGIYFIVRVYMKQSWNKTLKMFYKIGGFHTSVYVKYKQISVAAEYVWYINTRRESINRNI
jgi:hypothetical protein